MSLSCRSEKALCSNKCRAVSTCLCIADLNKDLNRCGYHVLTTMHKTACSIASTSIVWVREGQTGFSGSCRAECHSMAVL